jgi:biopolymer transport protein ExbD
MWRIRAQYFKNLFNGKPVAIGPPGVQRVEDVRYDQLMDALGLLSSVGFTKVSLIAEGAKPK